MKITLKEIRVKMIKEGLSFKKMESLLSAKGLYYDMSIFCKENGLTCPKAKRGRVKTNKSFQLKQ